jgi:hypothetical protein
MRIENELKLDFSDVLIRPKINLVFLNNKDNQSVCLLNHLGFFLTIHW